MNTTLQKMRFQLYRQPDGRYAADGLPVFVPCTRGTRTRDRAELARMVQATNASARTGFGRPKVLVGHGDTPPVLGRCENVRQVESGGLLLDLRNLRPALAWEMLNDAFPQVSVGLGTDFTTIEHLALVGSGESHFETLPFEYYMSDADRAQLEKDKAADSTCRLFKREETIVDNAITPEMTIAISEVIDEKLQPLMTTLAMLDGKISSIEKMEKDEAKAQTFEDDEVEINVDADDDDDEEEVMDEGETFEDDEVEINVDADDDDEEEKIEEDEEVFTRKSAALKEHFERAQLQVENAKLKGEKTREQYERGLLKCMDQDTFPNREDSARDFAREICKLPAKHRDAAFRNYTKLLTATGAPSGRIPKGEKNVKVSTAVRELYERTPSMHKHISLEDYAKFKRSGEQNLSTFIRKNNIQKPE